MNTTASLPSSSVSLRIDPEHELCELMRQAISRFGMPAIDVEVASDAVHLTGVVDSWHAKQHAQECIRGLAGSRAIQNSVSVTRRF